MSAYWSRRPGSSASPGASATPMLAVTMISWPSSSNGSTSASRSRQHRIRPWSGPSTPTWMSANSSPPRRATVSVSRTHASRRLEHSLISRSPAACPSVSLTLLKRSRSTIRTAIMLSRRRRPARAWSRRWHNSSRFGSSVIGSCSARWWARSPALIGAVRHPAPEVAERLSRRHRPAESNHAVGSVPVVEKVAERPCEKLLGRKGHGFGEALRQIDEPSVGIGFPDPIGACLGDVAKARLPRFDRLGRLARMDQHQPREARNEHEREQKRRQDVADQLFPAWWRPPRQAAEVGAVGRPERQRRLVSELRLNDSQIPQPERVGDRGEEILAIDALGIDQHGAGPWRRLDRLGWLGRGRA